MRPPSGTCGCPAAGLAVRPEVAGAELPPRSAAAALLAGPPALSLGLCLGSAGCLRPLAALMSVEEEPAAGKSGRLGAAPGLGKGRGRGWRDEGSPGTREILSDSSRPLSPVGSHLHFTEGTLKPREMNGSESAVGSRQRQMPTQVLMMPEAGQFHPVSWRSFFQTSLGAPLGFLGCVPSPLTPLPVP